MHEKLLGRFNSQSSAWISNSYVDELRCVRQLRDAEFFVQDAMLTLPSPLCGQLD